LEGLATNEVCIFCGRLVYFVVIYVVHLCVFWYIFSRFGILYQEESGNPVAVNEQKASLRSFGLCLKMKRPSFNQLLMIEQKVTPLYQEWNKTLPIADLSSSKSKIDRNCQI
jgi:hypothetical protein